jgi:hypothetical protein
VTLTLLVVAALAAVNAPRARSALPEDDAVAVAGLGALATLAALVPLAAFAHPLADAVRVPGSTARMAVGVVLLVLGAAELLLLPPPAAAPALPGRWSSLVPVAFPVLLNPALGFLTLSASLDRGAPVALAAAAAALATVPVLGAGWRSRTPASLRIARALSRTGGAVLIGSGIALLINGLYDL